MILNIYSWINFSAPTKEKKKGEKENPGARKRVDVFYQI